MHNCDIKIIEYNVVKSLPGFELANIYPLD